MLDHKSVPGTKAKLLAMIIASSVCFLGASDIVCASVDQSADPAAQAHVPTPEPATEVQSPATEPSGAAQSHAPAPALPIILPSVPALAQMAGSANQARQTARGHGRPTLDDRVKVLAKNLDLSEAQQFAVKKILEQRQQEILRIRLDPSIAGSARIDRFRALQENTVEQIRAVLNEEQKKKYDPLAPRRIPPPPQPTVEDWLKAITPH